MVHLQLDCTWAYWSGVDMSKKGAWPPTGERLVTFGWVVATQTIDGFIVPAQLKSSNMLRAREVQDVAQGKVGKAFKPMVCIFFLNVMCIYLYIYTYVVVSFSATTRRTHTHIYNLHIHIHYTFTLYIYILHIHFTFTLYIYIIHHTSYIIHIHIHIHIHVLTYMDDSLQIHCVFI